ncbi:MAG: ABC transporter substrate-binding protein [Dehalococcoidales bacterium]|nr:ABC transporter substrate-binding protein [Dehalococcoidales bacterium]
MKRISVLLSMVLTIILLLSVMTSACGPKAKPEQVLKVGVMTPSTGPVPEKGIPGQHGFADAVTYINKELGGAAGHPIELIWRDSAYDMQKVGTIVQDFMDAGCLIFATHSSTEMKAASGKSNEAGFPGIAAFISTINLHPPTHVYGPTPDYGDDWVAFAKYYMENIWKGPGKPKMALHGLANPTGLGARHGAQAKAAELGIELVDIAEHKISTLDETVSLQRMKDAKIDVLFISSTPAPTAIIIKNARDLGMFPGITIGCAAASFGKALVDLGGEAVEGVYGIAHMASWDDNTPGVAKLREYCEKNNPQDLYNDDYLHCWTTMLIMREILVQAVKNAGYNTLAKGGKTAWKAVEEQGIFKLKDYTADGLVGGTVRYAGGGDNRLNNYLRLFQVQSGKIIPVTAWQEAPLIKYETFDWWGK